MNPRIIAASALVFSGFTALVYEILWTRLLGFVFGTTSQSIGTVLAIFFGGMAIGNALAARRLVRVRNPLRLYALLELGIGAFALVTFPALRHLDVIYAWFGADHGPGVLLAMRFIGCAVVLLPPTIAMGATLPVVARSVVGDDASLGRWSGILYACNTLGAVAGAYLSGFWLIPALGLTRTLLCAASVNLAVAAAILFVAERRQGRESDLEEALAAARDDDPEPARTAFLVFFGVSGFVAIGYEVVWSKLFSIVMEGTLYGFTTVLSAYLFGIGIGSLLMSPVVDRIRDLPRAFALIHVGIAAAVTAGIAVIPWLHYANQRLGQWWPGSDATHLLFALVAPVVLLPAALFGAAFPVLIRIYTRRAGRAGQGIGVAVAVNTAGSIAASLLLGFWAIERLGMDATLFALILLDLAVALLVLLGFQATRGLGRLAATGSATLVLGLVAFSYNGVGLDRTTASRHVVFEKPAHYRASLARALANQIAVFEGRNAVVTVSDDVHGRGLRTNGLPESGTLLAPPYRPLTASLLGVVPYLVAENPQRALVIGLGGGNTVHALLQTDLAELRVIELEEAVVSAVEILHEGRSNPLEDPRVELRVNDGRNELLLGRHRGEPGFDVIASQPSHPWLLGAANLFTEEYFKLARGALSEGGVFAAWLNGFRTDPESILAVVTSFERIFPGSAMLDVSKGQGRLALLLLGSRKPIHLDTGRMAERLASPALRGLLAPHQILVPEDLLARFEARGADLAGIDPAASNTDDNAFVETRIPRRREWYDLDYSKIESRLDPRAPLLPPFAGALDAELLARRIAEQALLPGPNRPRAKLERWLRNPAREIDPVIAETLRAALDLASEESRTAGVTRLQQLASEHPERPEALRALGHHHGRGGADAAAAAAFAEAHGRSGVAKDAYLAASFFEAVDLDRARLWAARIPAEERAGFPRLAVIAARTALDQGADAASLEAHQRALLAYRDTDEGRTLRGLAALLADVAEARGDTSTEQRWRDEDTRERTAAVQPLLEQVREELAAGRIAEARVAWQRAAERVPGHLPVLDLRVAIESAAGQGDALQAALLARRDAARPAAAAIAWENHFRRQAGLPLLPERSLAELEDADEEPLPTPAAGS